MSDCYVPGCRDEPVVRLKYRDSLGELCVEARCTICARTLRNSDRTSIVDIVELVDTEETGHYSQLTEEERKFVEKMTDPFNGFGS